MKWMSGLLLVGLLAAPVSAQVTLDGSIAGDGYSVASVQKVDTDFGDNQSELNAAYARVDGSTLYLTLTGQVQNNFNKLNVFIDSIAGGQNTIAPGTNQGGSNPNNDDWAQNYSGVGPAASQNGPGFTFDAGFDADYMLILRNGNSGGDRFDVDYAVVGGGAAAFEAAGNIFGGSLTGSNASALPGVGIGVAYNNTNAAGVGGGSGAANPVAAAAVQTGIELAIPLSAIGNPGPGDIVLISAHVNGSNHDYLSNQSLGGFTPPQGNPGGNGSGGFNNDVSMINLNSFADFQYFPVTIPIPEPSTLALAGLAVCGLAANRRRQK